MAEQSKNEGFIKYLFLKYWPLFTFASIYFFIFRKVFLNGLLPFPGDLLVSWFFPYRAGGWEGYSSWTTHKEFILADVVRQLYPWRTLAMDMWKDGMVPLWNTYAFSGTPLLANVQSAVLYPLNVLMLLHNEWGWIVYIMIQPLLSTYFMYIFIRSLKLSKVSALVAGIGFSFIGYCMVWFEMGVLGHAALWLPLILWGITRYVDAKKFWYLVIAAIGIACSILAGHTQTTVYVLLLSLAYFIVIAWGEISRKQLFAGFGVLFLGLTLASAQIIPSLELMTLSPRDALNSAGPFFKMFMPWSHMAMLIAPDFFGNPATGNFWGKDYGEFMSYSGVVLFMTAIIGFYTYFQNRVVRLLLITTVLSFLVALPTPFPWLLFNSHIPVLSTGLPGRILFLVGTCLAIASAFGIEAIIKLNFKKLLPPVLGVLSLYAIMWVVVFTLKIDPADLAVTKRNIILPTAIACFVGFMILAKQFYKYTIILWIVIFTCMGFEYSYFMNKYLPMAPKEFMFPEHPFMTKINEVTTYDRVYGYDAARLETNTYVSWRIPTLEGYDPLFIKRYSEFMRAGTIGVYEKELSRTDALIPLTLPIKDEYPKQVVLNLTGTKYALDQDDDMPKVLETRPNRFPPNRFELIYQEYKWKMYNNTQAVPRAVIFYDYTVIPDDETAVNTLFDKSFPYQKKVILETKPSVEPKIAAPIPATITSYGGNRVEITTDSKEPGILFLSDNFYPGWKATLDGNSTNIFRADHTFRAVEVPAGKHTVIFEYQPISFYIGVAISLLSGALLFVLWRRKPLAA